MTWMRKSTSMMVSRDMKLKKLQLVTGEQVADADQVGQLDISGETRAAKTLRTLNRPQTLRGWRTTRHTFHSEIGAHSALQVVDEVLRADELW